SGGQGEAFFAAKACYAMFNAVGRAGAAWDQCQKAVGMRPGTIDEVERETALSKTLRNRHRQTVRAEAIVILITSLGIFEDASVPVAGDVRVGRPRERVGVAAPRVIGCLVRMAAGACLQTDISVRD